MNSKFRKKGVIGSFTVMFVATILIILILIGYTILGVFFKTLSGGSSGLDNKYKEAEVSYDAYFDGFRKLAEARVFVNDGQDIVSALNSAKYYEDYVPPKKKVEGYIDDSLPGGGIVAG